MPRKPRSPPVAPTDRATAYARAVVSGAVMAGPHVRAECARHLRDLEGAAARGWVWDLEAATRAIEFFPTCLTVEVKGETVPFTLLDWQAFVVGRLFGWKLAATGFRRFREAYIETGKGSGKSPLAAGLGLYLLIADGEPRAEIYAAAAKRDQAAVMFRDAVAMWRRMPPRLRAKLTTSGGAGHEWNLAYPDTSSFFRVIASEGGQSGPRPHGGFLDEVHEHADETMVNLMRAGTKGRRQALIFMITNSGATRSGVCWDYHQYAGKVAAGDIDAPSFFTYVCASDPGDDPINDESVWPKTNPSMGHTFQPDYLRELVQKTRGMPSAEAVVRRLNFCEWTDAESPWVDRDLWDACESDDVDTDALAGVPCYLGLDLASKRDLTALAAVWVHPDGTMTAQVWFWSPGDTLEERGRQDSTRYDLWRDQGHLFAPAGRTVNKAEVAVFLRDALRRHDIRALAYDQAMADDFLQACDDVGLDAWIDDRARDSAGEPVGPDGAGIRMIRHGQGYAGYASDKVLWMPRSVDRLEDAVIGGQITIARNPVLRANSANAVLVPDPQGNRKWDKRKSTGRIDGIVALCMAVGAASAGTPPPRPSIWAREELWT